MESAVLQWLLAVFAPHQAVTMWVAIPIGLTGFLWALSKAVEQVAKAVVAVCKAVVTVRKTIIALRKALKCWRK